MSQSDAELWPDATRGIDPQDGSTWECPRPESEILENRASRVGALDFLNGRMVGQYTTHQAGRRVRERNKIHRGQESMNSEGKANAPPESKSHFQRCRPARADLCPNWPKHTDGNTLRTYISEKSGVKLGKSKASSQVGHRAESMASGPDGGLPGKHRNKRWGDAQSDTD